jgi:hypothetical protein
LPLFRAHAAKSFTDAQLDAIERARHPWFRVAWTRSAPLCAAFARLYLVLLIGRERRHAPRPHAITRIGQTTLAMLLLIAAALAAILAI